MGRVWEVWEVWEVRKVRKVRKYPLISPHSPFPTPL